MGSAHSMTNDEKMFARSVPDEIVTQKTPKNIGKFRDTSDLSCTEDYDAGNTRNSCIAGRKALFAIKTKKPQIFNTCKQFHQGTQMISSCMISWSQDKHWSSSSQLTSQENLALRGCIKNGGSNINRVNECLGQYGLKL